MKFCQIFLLYLQIFLQTRFAGLRRNLDSDKKKAKKVEIPPDGAAAGVESPGTSGRESEHDSPVRPGALTASS